MKKWIDEEWEFHITAIKGEAPHCRMGIEKGDTFYCTYSCPAGFCPKTMPVLHTLCEIVRCGGNYKLRGSKSEHEITFPCADGCIEFKLTAKQIDTK